MTLAGVPSEERQKMALDLIARVRERLLTAEKVREWDEGEIFPEAELRALLGREIGLHLLFIPEAYGGMGGGARDMAIVSEALGKICVGVASGFLVTRLGTDPILVAGTEAQKQKWVSKVADGAIVAYAVTEPEAGSNLPHLKTTAVPVLDGTGKKVAGYRLNGSKQFISNGGYADFLTVLAQTPEGPSFFVVESSAEGFSAGRPERKHGIRASDTRPLSFVDVVVPAENLIGGLPGRGLTQANAVFGFTRLMVAALALGAGEAALEKVVSYAKERVQFGSALIKKQAYTHKLVVPFAAQLEAARAYIERVAARLDAGEADLQAEGSLAKLFASETANACADAAIQALGGYGYIREYDVEKIKRDVKITTIYEGTSEIQQLIVSMTRWRNTIQSKGAFYQKLADEMDAVVVDAGDVKAGTVARIFHLLARLFDEVHKAKATTQQHLMFRLATLTTTAETAAALTTKAASAGTEYLRLCARINNALSAQTAMVVANEILFGTGLWPAEEAQAIVSLLDFGGSQSRLVLDMDALQALLSSRRAA